MKARLSWVLIVCIVGSPLSAAGGEPETGPIARAMQREASRLAVSEAVDVSATSAEPQSKPSSTDWSRVIMLKPRKSISVTVKGGQRQLYKFGTADDHQMVVRDAARGREVIARSDVAEVTVLGTRGSVGAAVGGVVLGTLIGFSTAVNLGLNVRCQPSCGGVEALMVLSAVGIPIAAGVGGYYASAQPIEEVIYRAP